MVVRIRCEYSLYRYWGVPTRYIDLIRYLDPEEYHVTSHSTPDIEAEHTLPDWILKIRGWLECWIQRGGMAWYKLGDLGAEIEALRSCQAGETNIVHFMDGEHSGQFLPRRLKECGLSIKTVATFHQPPALLPELVSEEILRWLDAIVLVSPTQLPFFRSRVPEEKLHVIRLGVDTDLFHPAQKRKRSESLVCITTGLNLRDWDTFNQVAQALPDVKFVVVTSPKIKIQQATNVEVHSGLGDRALADMYRSADVVFLPLLDSTANNTLLEGIATGLPVVTTDLQAVRAYLPDEAGIFVDDNSVEKFVAALRTLQRDRDLRREMGRCARARAEELAWKKVIEQYEVLYATLNERPANIPPARLNGVSVEAKSNGFGHDPIRTVKDQFEVYLSDCPGTSPRPIDIWGHALVAAGFIDEASTLFHALAVSFPDDPGGYAGLAEVAERHWQWQKAIEYLTKCSAMSPADSRAQFSARIAECLIQTGRIHNAKVFLTAMSDHFEGLLGLAQIGSLTVPPSKALPHWEKCTKQYPDRIEGFLGLATILIQAGTYAEADGLLDYILNVWPESLAARVLWARAATAARNVREAGARWSALVNDCESGRHYCHNQEIGIGYARYLGLAEDHNAAESFVARLADYPVAAAQFRSEYHLARSDLEAAIQHGYELVKLSKNDPSHRVRQAALLLRRGSAEALQAAYSIIKALYDGYHGSIESVEMKAELAELCIRLDRDNEATQVINTIPQEDTRIQVEILRIWSDLNRDGNLSAKKYWRALFLDLGMIEVAKWRFMPW